MAKSDRAIKPAVGVKKLKKLSNKAKGITPGVIDYDGRSFIINGKRELLVGGEFHYFRTPCELWEDRIVKMKRSGSNQVTTYIAWNWHEPREGQHLWSGDHDLAHFIELCQKHDMFVVVKPGPYICAEWDFGGHPDWLLSKGIPLRVLDDEYLSYVEKWYKKVAEVIKPYLITNGGKVFAIQVENEYDHLMHFGEEKITEEDAIEYFRRLAGFMTKYGIDIPKFANEAAFLRGSGLIDTRTYYPSIPWFWHWELHNYDTNMAQAKEGQPDCPSMVLELQSGWFTMFGQPPFDPPPILTEAVTNSSLSGGASFLNLYMFVGGTTFPFWTCRGDIFDLYPAGTGTTTSFDFGGSPIREWGELMPGRYDWVKIFNTFTQTYKDLILMSDLCDDVKAIGGGEDVCVLNTEGAGKDTCVESSSERFGILTNKLDDQYLVCVRNMGENDKVVDLGWSTTDKPILKNLVLKSRESFILPINVKVPDTDIRIKRSSSSLLFAKKINENTVFGLFGKKGRKGELVLDVPASKVKVQSGNVKVSGGKKTATLKYTHEGVQVVKVDGNTLVLLDQDLASKVEVMKNGVLIADTYFVKKITERAGKVSLKTQMRPNSANKFVFVGENGVSSAKIAKKNAKVIKKRSKCEFSVKTADEKATKFAWKGEWKARADIAEAQVGYDDSKWQVLDKPMSLENAELFEHGWIWYRSEFNVPKGVQDVSMSIPGNDADRFYVYVNGKQVWFGITEKRVTEFGIGDALKPGKNTVAVLYTNFYHNKSHPHEGDIMKHSGLAEAVIVSGTKDGKPFARKIKKFKVREQLNGHHRGYQKEYFNDSKWQTLPQSEKYVMNQDVGEIVWLRRNFTYECKKGWEAGVKITIPDAKDRCFMYLNGRPLGQFEHIGPQYDFYVPAPFLKKENQLTIVVESAQTFMDVCRGYLVEPQWGTFYDVKDVDVSFEVK